MATFGQRFAGYRKDKKLTQEEVAERLNISAQAVSKWENDISMPDISLLSDIADLFEVSIDELLGREDKKAVAVLPEGERRDINKMILRVSVDSSDGDRVKVNLPMALVKVCIECGMTMPEIGGNEYLKNLDLAQILALVEQGVVGELVSVDSADGDHVSVWVE